MPELSQWLFNCIAKIEISVQLESAERLRVFVVKARVRRIHRRREGRFLGLRAEKGILYPSGMLVDEVKLEAVDTDDERFRISEDLDPVRLEESLRQVGQLHPVQLLEIGR